MSKVTVILLLCVLLVATACGGKEGGGGTYQAKGDAFAAALFEQRLDDAKALALADFSEDVSADVDAFAALLEKYDFQNIPTEATSDATWSSTGANTQIDRKLSFYFEFRTKGTEAWKIGWLEVRALNANGSWGIADLVLARPKR